MASAGRDRPMSSLLGTSAATEPGPEQFNMFKEDGLGEESRKKASSSLFYSRGLINLTWGLLE